MVMGVQTKEEKKWETANGEGEHAAGAVGPPQIILKHIKEDVYGCRYTGS